MQQWEYIIVMYRYSDHSRKAMWQKDGKDIDGLWSESSDKQMLDFLGNQGWELVEIRVVDYQYDGREVRDYIFKRPKP